MSDSDVPNILVLEDDPDMRELLTEVLETQGYSVTAVGSGLEAVSEAAERSYALIVADIRMEGMNGLEALAQTKTHQPNIGSLIVSGYASAEETQRASELGVGAYLKKPFRMKRFLEAVRAQLDRVSHAERVLESENRSEEATLWALESFIGTIDQAGLFVEPESLERAGRLAGQVGKQLGLSSSVIRQVKLATQFVLLENADCPQPPDWLLEDESLLAPFSRALSVPTSREAQIARLCALVESEDEPQEPESLTAEPELSTEVVNAYEAVTNSSERAPEEERLTPSSGLGRAGGLLALARTFSHSQDTSNAEAAYRKAQSLAQEPDQQAMIRLEHLEFALKSGRDFEQLSSDLEELQELREQLGPFASARLNLELGLLLKKANQNVEAVEVLDKAAFQLDRLGQETLEGVARVALQSLGQDQADLDLKVGQLLHPSGLDQLLSRADWLVPSIAEAPISSDILNQFLQRSSRELSLAVSSSLISIPSRRRILERLAELPTAPEELVDAFLKDSDPEIRTMASKLGRGEKQLERPLLRLYSFGPFEAYLGEELIPTKSWRTKKTMYLVARMAEAWPRSITEETLLDQFWPDSLKRGKRNLYWSLSMARGCLKVEELFNPIVRESGRLSLNGSQGFWHDVTEFRRALEESKTAKGRQHAVNLAQLLRLYRGPYLDGCYLDWAVRLRDEFERLAAEAFHNLAAVMMDEEMFEEAAEAARESLRVAPTRQETHLLLMRICLKRRLPLQALEQFKACEQILRLEYELEPGIELVKAKLEAEMMQG